jgi:hypothetical protein
MAACLIADQMRDRKDAETVTMEVMHVGAIER